MARPSVGIIGAGLMGAGMARRLLAKGYPVSVVVHRNRTLIDPLLTEGASEAPSVEDLVKDHQWIILCLPNADVVESVLSATAATIGSGSVILDATTSLPSTSRKWARELLERDIGFVDAPVTGTPAEAASGEIVFLVGGTEPAVSASRPLLEAMSRDILYFGGSGKGHTAKLINNCITQAQSALTIEAVRRCDRLGIDRKLMFKMISESSSRSGTFMKIMPSVLAGTYDGHKFSISNAAKDVRYVAELCTEIDEASPLVNGLLEFYRRESEAWPPDTYISQILR